MLKQFKIENPGDMSIEDIVTGMHKSLKDNHFDSNAPSEGPMSIASASNPDQVLKEEDVD